MIRDPLHPGINMQSSILFSFLMVLTRHQYPSFLYCSLYTSYITNMENLFINQGLPFPFFSWLYWYIEKWYCKEILDAGHSTLYHQDLFSHSPYYLPYIAYTSSSENLLLDHVMIPQLIFFNILITCLLDIVLIM